VVDEIYGRIDPALLEDVEFQSYRLFLETRLEPNKVEEFARGFAETFPETSQAYEILGWSLWKQGRKDEAISQLLLAMKYSPEDEYLKKMYRELKSKNAGPEAYKGRMHLGIKFEDLYR
jgi:hypothetical protein